MAGQIGLGVAVDYANSLGQRVIYGRIVKLASALREHLESIPSVAVHDIGREQAGIVSFSTPVIDSETLMHSLRNMGINCSTSSITSTRLDMGRRELELVNRASVHYYNTEGEVRHFAEAISGLVR